MNGLQSLVRVIPLSLSHKILFGLATNRALRAPMEGVVHSISPARRKLQGYEFYREVLGSPRYVVAPMVDQSELVGDIRSQHT